MIFSWKLSTRALTWNYLTKLSNGFQSKLSLLLRLQKEIFRFIVCSIVQMRYSIFLLDIWIPTRWRLRSLLTRNRILRGALQLARNRVRDIRRCIRRVIDYSHIVLIIAIWPGDRIRRPEHSTVEHGSCDESV